MSDFSLPVENVPDIPFTRLIKFVRQVTHDVRNGLNAIDLQAAYLGELAGEGELGEEAGKMRQMIAHVTADMQELSARFAELRPVIMECPVEDFLLGLKEAVDQEFGNQAKRVVWESKMGKEEVEMDYTMLSNALMELVRNAIYFREGDQAVHFTASDEGGKATFEVRQKRSQPDTKTEKGGKAPLDSNRRGGYGLGLFYVRRIMDTLRGELDIGYDAKAGELRARVSLPLKKPGGSGGSHE
jgi:signal transduction histidine kinase